VCVYVCVYVCVSVCVHADKHRHTATVTLTHTHEHTHANTHTGLPKKKKACDLNLGGNKVKAPAVSKPPSGMLGGFQPPSASAKSVTPEERNVINTQVSLAQD
jgi:hypothetical protein